MRIFLTDFVDFVLATGSKKGTKVKALLRSETKKAEYNSFEDWLPIRNAIQSYLRDGGSGAALDRVLARANPSRKPRYEKLIAGFLKYRGRRELKWVEPPTLVFSHSTLSVTCKPDIGVVDRGVKSFFKLHYGQLPPSKERVDVIAEIMRSAAQGVSAETDFGVLDLRRGNPRPRKANRSLAESLEIEAEAFISYWNRYRADAAGDVAS